MLNLKSLIIRILNRIAPNILQKRYQRKIEKEFYRRFSSLKNKNKIIYALTPPPRLSNIGDQAQVVAIYKWLSDYYPNLPILEVNKDECISMTKPLKRLIKPDDLIFIHSGGNLGDRGMWSETGRRSIITNFPGNKIISLPQTIYFSKTEKGQIEKEISEKIYNQHENLTVIGRDPVSGEIASKMFPKCKTFSMPDFVLYLKADDFLEYRNTKPNGTLFCLRKDNESALKEEDRELIFKFFDPPYESFDTTIESPIYPHEREKYLKNTLAYFDRFQTIVTDRYHGLIFATILHKPTIVLPTVDHKLTSAFQWFKEIENIYFLKIEELSNISTLAKNIPQGNKIKIDWRKKYFENLIERI